MTILRILLLIVEAVCALLLIGVILLQKSKSEGLGMAFGSGMGETLFGSRAGNVLTKITITLGIVFLVTTTLLAVMSTSSKERSLIDERVADTPLSPVAPSAAPQAPLTSTEPMPAPTAPAAVPALAPTVPLGQTPPAEPPAAPPAAPTESASQKL